MWEEVSWDGDRVSCYCGGKKPTSEESWSLPEVSTNGTERNYSSANEYILFYMVGELKWQRFSSWGIKLNDVKISVWWEATHNFFNILYFPGVYFQYKKKGQR